MPYDEPRAADTLRLSVLADAARRLHGEADLAKVLGWVVDAAGRMLATGDTALCLLPRDASPAWVVNPRATVSWSLLADPRAFSIVDAPLHRREPAVVPDLEEHDAGAPPPDRIRRVLPLGRLLVIPVASKDDTLHALLFAGASEPGRFETDEVEALVALASHLGIAIDNHTTLTRLEEEEARGKEVVHRLQEAVRPPAPVVPHAELGVHYVPADPSAPTGGDLYDWIVLPDGDLHVAVVDVMGKGVEATKHAVAVTHALRLLAVQSCPLGEVVTRTDELVTAQNPDLVATLLVARYTPSTGHLRIAGAGHPPALLVHRDGTVEEIAAPGIPIGWPGAGSHGVVERTLERSDTLILYTDGLIEARKDILQGLSSLADAASATATYPATSLARVLVERQLSKAARHDDTLSLVLRRRTPPVEPARPVLGPLEHRFSPTPAAVPVARHLLNDWLARVPVEAEAIDELLIVASELASNAVRHASGAPGSIHLRAWAQADSVIIEVSDDGGDVVVEPVSEYELPDPEAEQGRGLFLVRQLADEVEAATDGGRTFVRVTKRAVIGTPAEVAALPG